MGLLDLFQRRGHSRGKGLGQANTAELTPQKLAGQSASSDLFDEAFQRKLETLALTSKRVFAGRQRADRPTTRKGNGIEFADHRDYTPGDDFRFVDWSAYQRFGKLLVRLNEEHEDLCVYFLLDCSRSMGFRDGAKFDQARRLCAALAYVSLANLDRVTLLGLNSDAADSPVARKQPRLPPTRGKAQIFKVFRFLNALTAEGGTDLAQSLKTFVAQNKRRGFAVLVTDLYDPNGYQRGIDVLRHNKFEPFLLHIGDAREYKPQFLGDALLSDCETGESREITLTEQLTANVAQAYQNYCQEVQQYCRANQVGYLMADVSIPFDQVVLSALRRGGLLG